MRSSPLSLLEYYPPLSLVRDALKGRGARIFLVGGALRDYCLGRRGTDLDFAVDRDSIALARQLARRIHGAFVLLDAAHGSARVIKKMDGAIWSFDLTDWRGKSIQKDLEQGSLLGLIMGVQISDPNKSYAIASNRIQQEYFNYRNSILD